MRVDSVQISKPHLLDTGHNVITTGIDKQPVDSAVFASTGVVGDHVVNEVHHGGVDQAVYVYSTEDYAWWEDRLRQTLSPGSFGENLTLSSFGQGSVRIGDRYTIGDVTLEVTSPRIPCGTFAAHLGIDDWSAQFRDGRRPGWYARVLTEGLVSAGDGVSLQTASASNVDLLEVFDLYYDHHADRQRIEAAVRSPLAERAMADYVQRLARH